MVSNITVSSVHVNAPLTEFSLRYTNDDFIAEKLAPKVKVVFESDVYYKYDRSNFKKESTTIVAAGDPSREVTYGVSATPTYKCEQHKLKMKVIDRVRKNSDAALNPDTDAVQTLLDKLMIDYEIQIATLATTAGNYASSKFYTTLSGSSLWDNYSTSDPIKDVRTATSQVHKGGLFKMPNTMVVGKDVHDALLDNPKILDRIKYVASSPATVENSDLARVFGVKNYIVAGCGYDTDAEGQTTVTSTYIWGNKVVLAYVNPNPGLRSVTFASTFQQQDRLVKKWRQDDIESDWVEASNGIYDAQVISNIAGFLFEKCIA